MQTTEEWRRLGKDDPFFAVSAHEGKRGKWDRGEFYALGRSDWRDFAGHWRSYQSKLGGVVVEIGSGAGRITQCLVQDFDRVVGLDVSPDMIRLAQEAAPGADLRLVDGTQIPLGDGEADAVFTCHVLQHLESLGDVASYLSESRRVLRAGGTAMVHLLLDEGRPSWLHRAWAEVKLRAVRAMRANRGAYSRVRRYRADQIRSVLEGAGFTDVELHEFRVMSNGSAHSFWFARA